MQFVDQVLTKVEIETIKIDMSCLHRIFEGSPKNLVLADEDKIFQKVRYCGAIYIRKSWRL